MTFPRKQLSSLRSASCARRRLRRPSPVETSPGPSPVSWRMSTFARMMRRMLSRNGRLGGSDSTVSAHEEPARTALPRVSLRVTRTP
ncbi:hypothetical protein EDF42_1084 [Curtobacterium sp. PhB172]|nr:hypothetical protein EDF42_1084 [Curtobacterium sp. PhB172]